MDRRIGMIGALLAACSPEPGPVRPTEQAITAGVDDAGDPAVVALQRDGQTVCTGTLVAPRVILTAGHCVAGVDAVVVGAEPAASTDRYDVILARTHRDFDPGTLTGDLGLLLLDRTAAVEPVAMVEAGVALDGATVRLVGFGRTAPDDDSAARKREGTARVDSVTATGMRVTPDPSQACEGDSGGPALFDSGAGDGEGVVGVVSSGDPACAGYTDLVRVSAYAADFVTPFIAATADGSAATGARCYDDATCAAGTCYFPDDAPSIGYCTIPCGACPGAMECVEDTCRHPRPSPGADGAGCESAADCDSEVCAEPAAGPAVCAQRCVPDVFGCDDGFRCADDVAAPGSSACFPTGGGGCDAGGKGGGLALMWLGASMMLLRRPRVGRTV